MKKFLALALMLLMLLSAAMLTSCDTQTDDPSTSDSSSSDAVDTTPEPVTDLELVVDGVAKISVIRSADLDPSSLVVTAAAGLRQHIINVTEMESSSNSDFPINDDWIKPGEDYDHDTLEILVGSTGYSESQEVLSELGYGEYIVKIVGNKIVVAGYTETAVNMAANKLKSLITSCATDKNLTIPADTLITGVVDEDINALPRYENGTLSSTYSCGNGATELIFTDTTPEAYTAYLAKLEQAGYTTYTTNTITDNYFATLNSDKYTVNAGYYAYEKSVRVIIEDLETPVGLESDNVYTAVTTSQITMLGLEYTTSSGEVKGNGLSLLIRLTDGRFIVIDGGFNRAKDAQMLVNLLKEQSADYIGNGKITIAAWIITHAHGDHLGMIANQSGYFKSMNVERFIVNFMSDTERNKAMASTSYSSNWSSGEGGGWTNLVQAAGVLNADVQYARVGQVFYMADAKLEVLYTIDSYGPKVCNALNTTSLIIKFTFGDGTTFMMTGDATGPAFQICSKMYGSYLKCDILQVAHHGYTTWGTESGTISAYRLIAPSMLLWPQGSKAYPNYKGKSYNIVLFSKEEGGSNANFKECYVAGAEGDTVVVPIPYTVGNVTVTRN